MQLDKTCLDSFLAAAVLGRAPEWPTNWDSQEQIEAVRQRIDYHGVAGLLHTNGRDKADWPPSLVECIARESTARSMWEIRHKIILTSLCNALADQGIAPIFLKGTAMAYGYYASPSVRIRGDSDLFVSPALVIQTREVLRSQGFEMEWCATREPLQEPWTLCADDESDHVIDLHWSLVNAPALRHVFPACALKETRALSKLSPHAFALAPEINLAHTCVHRAMHRVSPYFVGEKAYVGGDRLIWLHDITLLARELSEIEWANFLTFIDRHGVADVCRATLQDAHRAFGCPLPPQKTLFANRPITLESRYLLQMGQVRRAWADLMSTPGIWSKVKFALGSLFPEGAFLRAKYPRLRNWPIPILALRRIADFVVRRSPNSAAP